MRIYYPSLTPIHNYTYSYEPESSSTLIVSAVGAAIVSVGTIGFVAHALLNRPVSVSVSTNINNNDRHNNSDDDTCNIQISSSDLKEIEELLIQHRKQFKIL
jgi:hypothetical protein